MFNVVDYINSVLKKKNWTRRRLCKEINKIEELIGDRKTRVQNVTNYLNGYHSIGPKWLVKVEKALNLKEDTLVSMVESPKTRVGIKELKEAKEKVRNIK